MTKADSERLDWLLLNASAKFGDIDDGRYVRFWSSEPIAGFYIAKGKTSRDAIDAAVSGTAKLID